MKISELAATSNVSAATVRYYESIGLLPPPARTESGYRDYAEADAARLAFVVRARNIGLALEQIAEVLPVWDGVNCAATHEQMVQLVVSKRAETVHRIAEMQRFVDQLDLMVAELSAAPPPPVCRPDMSCCVPGGERTPVVIAGLGARQRSR